MIKKVQAGVKNTPADFRSFLTDESVETSGADKVKGLRSVRVCVCLCSLYLMTCQWHTCVSLEVQADVGIKFYFFKSCLTGIEIYTFRRTEDI